MANSLRKPKRLCFNLRAEPGGVKGAIHKGLFARENRRAAGLFGPRRRIIPGCEIWLQFHFSNFHGFSGKPAACASHSAKPETQTSVGAQKSVIPL
jgi:hypothetical protein